MLTVWTRMFVVKIPIDLNAAIAIVPTEEIAQNATKHFKMGEGRLANALGRMPYNPVQSVVAIVKVITRALALSSSERFASNASSYKLTRSSCVEVVSMSRNSLEHNASTSSKLLAPCIRLIFPRRILVAKSCDFFCSKLLRNHFFFFCCDILHHLVLLLARR